MVQWVACKSLTEQHESAEELPGEVDARFGELEAEIERLEAKRQAYAPAGRGKRSAP
jgi:ParB family transcriptional regulator, chromosome partitioning protein